MSQPLVISIASSSNNALGHGKCCPNVVTTSFVHEQIDVGLKDLVLELSKQLVGIVKPMVHNEIQMAQQRQNVVKENSAMSTHREFLTAGRGSANQIRG